MLVDCTKLVTNPIDASPIRSPQALHSAIASRLANRSLVEIGTRNGDGFACFARVARSALAVEASKPYCDKLRARGFAVVCSKYQWAATLDGA